MDEFNPDPFAQDDNGIVPGGLNGIDPVSTGFQAGGAAIGLVNSLIGSKDVKSQVNAAHEALKVQKELASTEIETQKRNQQFIALTIVGVGALALGSMLFYLGARQRKG